MRHGARPSVEGLWDECLGQHVLGRVDGRGILEVGDIVEGDFGALGALGALRACKIFSFSHIVGLVGRGGRLFVPQWGRSWRHDGGGVRIF